MKPMIGVVSAALLIGGSLPVPAFGQLGAIIDRIQKMSGPTTLYFGPIFRWGYQPGRRLEPVVDLDPAAYDIDERFVEGAMHLSNERQVGVDMAERVRGCGYFKRVILGQHSFCLLTGAAKAPSFTRLA